MVACGVRGGGPARWFSGGAAAVTFLHMEWRLLCGFGELAQAQRVPWGWCARRGLVCMRRVVRFQLLRAQRVRGGRVAGAADWWSWAVGRDDVVCVPCLVVCGGGGGGAVLDVLERYRGGVNAGAMVVSSGACVGAVVGARGGDKVLRHYFIQNGARDKRVCTVLYSACSPNAPRAPGMHVHARWRR